MRLKPTLILGAIVLLIATLGYSLYQTYQSGALRAGTVTDTGAGYIWTAHLHAYVPISICGEAFRLPVEVGPLTGPHTHEEKNIVHWHDKLPYDKERGAILDTRPLTLGAFFEAIGVPSMVGTTVEVA